MPRFPAIQFASIALLIAQAATVWAAEPTTEPTPLQEQKQRAESLIADIRNSPFSGPIDLSKSLRLRQEDAALVVGTSIVTTPHACSYRTPDGDFCSALLRVNRFGRPILLQVEYLDTSDPDQTYVHTSLCALPGKVMLAIERANLAVTSYVQLIDDRTDVRSTPGGAGQCRLYVQISDPEDHPISKVEIDAPDLKSMVAHSRSVVDLYLRQGLRGLGQERLLLPDEAAARQALTMDLPPRDVKLDQQIQQYVAQLASPNWNERSVATQSLRRLGEPAVSSLQSMKRQGLTVEQRNRVDDVVESAWPLDQPAARWMGADRAFVIDCLDFDDPMLRVLAQKRLEKLTGQPAPAELSSADQSIRRRAIDSLRTKWINVEPGSAKTHGEPTGAEPVYPNE
jgi:hypothetical protein